MSGGKCERCGKKTAEGTWDVSWIRTYCDKCSSIVKNETEKWEKERKRKAAIEAQEKEREYARQAELAKKRTREQKKYKEKILASGGRVCPVCGTALRPRLPEIALDRKTGKSTFKESWPSMCMSCRAHGREVLRRMR